MRWRHQYFLAVVRMLLDDAFFFHLFQVFFQMMEFLFVHPAWAIFWWRRMVLLQDHLYGWDPDALMELVRSRRIMENLLEVQK